MKAVIAVEAALAAALILLLLLPACRREQEPLDRNKAPETYLTSSPTETTATDYRVHMYWHGGDDDGVVNRYIWYISDTLLTLDPEEEPDAEQRDWNPAERIADYLKGRFTSQTDTVIIFKGFDDKKLATVNRQSFHIASIDDGGRIDPSPARIQFFARVRGVPTVQFWVNFGAADVPYDPANLDTISMFAPFTIKFLGSTINNVITGYRWSYGGKVLPDYNNDGNPDWYVPESQSEVVSTFLSNEGADALPSGAFNFKVIARDEAGALSRSDIISGEGVCRIVINHDPDTEILYGDCFYTPQSTGTPDSLRVYFDDAAPDTLPYNSLLRMRYRGWDDRKDELANDPPLPIRFQFAYHRWAIDETGAQVAYKQSPWYPLKTPEDTNPNADVEDTDRDVDSTTMRVGTFDYRFLARSFDEQNRPDGSPSVVNFSGNFPPAIDSVTAGFIDQRPPNVFRPARQDTIIIGWLGLPFSSRGDTLCPYEIKVVQAAGILTKYYRFIIRAGGHDDRRDPPGSGVKGWRYYVTDPEEDLLYYKEGEWQFDRPLNTLNQEIQFSITVPWKRTQEELRAQADSIVANPPLFLGQQAVTVIGGDVRDTETFLEGIRGISPKFDADGNVIPANNWITNEYFFANYARREAYQGAIYLKLVK